MARTWTDPADNDLEASSIACVGEHALARFHGTLARAPANSELGPGARLGRYLVRRQLGEGGMGVVHEGDDLLLGRRVALKIFRPESEHDQAAEQQQRVLIEAQALARLSHPNVVTIYDVGFEQGYLFIAMEYIDGGTLADFVSRRPRSWDEVLAAYHQAGLGLAAAHDAGITHRDFKPTNVLVTSSGRICVADFGLARLSPEPSAISTGNPRDLRLTRTGVVVGTPAFMSPEQLLGRPTDTRSDVFSFCVALFTDLYGDRPYEGNTLEDLRAAILAREIRPRPRNSRVPEWLHHIVLRGLRVDPAERPSSMRGMVDELGRARAAAGVDRATKILAEARRFGGGNAELAVSTVAVSLLTQAIDGSPVDPIAVSQPDLERLGDIEIAGDRVEAMLADFGPFRLLMCHLLHHESALPVDEDGDVRCEPTHWYPLAPLVHAIHRFERVFGTEASYHAGFAASRRLVGDQGAHDLASLVALADHAMLGACRRSAGPVGDAIGHHRLVEAGGTVEIASTSPWPSGYDHGFLAGLVARLGGEIVVERRGGAGGGEDTTNCHYVMHLHARPRGARDGHDPGRRRFAAADRKPERLDDAGPAQAKRTIRARP